MKTPVSYFVVLSAVLFAIGTVGVLVRRNALVIFMSVELQLNAVNLALVAFSRLHGNLNGHVLAFFSMVVAAAEVVVGLASPAEPRRTVERVLGLRGHGMTSLDAALRAKLEENPAAPRRLITVHGVGYKLTLS